MSELLVLTGEESLLRQRFLAHLIAHSGAHVETVNGEDPIALREAMDDPWLDPRPLLVVVEQPQLVDVETLEEIRQSGDSDTTVLLHFEGPIDGRTKLAKFLKKNNILAKDFPKPAEWDAPAQASQFLVTELARQGKTVNPAFAAALVQVCGNDLGVIRFEALKLVSLANSMSTGDITIAMIRDTMAVVGEQSYMPLVEALAEQNLPRLVKECSRIRERSSAPTMRAVALLQIHVTRWFQASLLTDLPAPEAAKELALNPWFYENKILPVSKRWGREGTVRLIQVLAESERAVKQGVIDPWSLFSSRLFSMLSPHTPSRIRNTE